MKTVVLPRFLLLFTLVSLVLPRSARAVVISEDPFAEESVEAGVVLRSFDFLFAGKVLVPPYNPGGESPVASHVFDARAYFLRRAPSYEFTLHQSFNLESSTSTLAGALGLGQGQPPPSFLPLTFSDTSDPALTLLSRTDWLSLALFTDSLSLTIGRQPVTLGRGTFWRTSDVVSTFSLTQVDTEYKPGADAIRLDFTPKARTNLMLLAVLGELESKERDFEADGRGSSALIQFKQSHELGELGLIAGLVRRDRFLSVDGVLNLSALDVYGEWTSAWLDRPGIRSLSAPAVQGELAFKGVLGSHWRPVPELTVTPEFFYNEFGSTDPDDYLAIALSERVAIGEQIALGRWYGALGNVWEVDPLTHLGWSMLVNLTDPSALSSAYVRRSLAEDIDLVLGGYVPMGRIPLPPALSAQGFTLPALRSEFGNYPYFFFLELGVTI